MAYISEVEIKIGVTLNLGNYQSARFDIGLSEILPDQTDIEDVQFGHLMDKIKTELHRQVIATAQNGKIVPEAEMSSTES